MKNFDKKANAAIMKINAAGYAVNCIGILKNENRIENQEMFALITETETFTDLGENFSVTSVYSATVLENGTVEIDDHDLLPFDINEAIGTLFKPMVMENYRVVGGKASWAA